MRPVAAMAAPQASGRRRRWPGAGRWVRLLAGAECGQAVVLVAVMLPLFLSIVGLAIDGGVVFAARRELQSTADAAARAGAAQIDVQTYRQTSGNAVVLDVPRARQAAAAYLAARRSGLSGTVDASQRRVVVEVSQDVPLAFLRIVGIERVRISAIAPAEVRYGVEQGQG